MSGLVYVAHTMCAHSSINNPSSTYQRFGLCCTCHVCSQLTQQPLIPIPWADWRTPRAARARRGSHEVLLPVHQQVHSRRGTIGLLWQRILRCTQQRTKRRALEWARPNVCRAPHGIMPSPSSPPPRPAGATYRVDLSAPTGAKHTCRSCSSARSWKCHMTPQTTRPSRCVWLCATVWLCYCVQLC